MKKKLLASLAVAAICLWLVLRNINKADLGEAFRNIEFWPLPWILVCMLLTHFFRARRWRALLQPIRVFGTAELFAINAVGFLAIHALPFRLGEVTRPLLLKKRHEIPFSTGLATVAVERIFDGLVAALALSIGVIASPFRVETLPVLDIGINALAFSACALFLACFGFLLLAVVHRDRAVRMISFFGQHLPEGARARVERMASNFLLGLQSLPNIRSITKIFFESLLVWGVMALAFWMGFKAFHLHLPWAAPFALLGIVSMGIILPAAPGFVGSYQLFMVAGLLLYGVPKETGLAYSIVMHALNLLYVCVAGFICLPRVATRMKTLFSEATHAEPKV